MKNEFLTSFLSLEDELLSFFLAGLLCGQAPFKCTAVFLLGVHRKLRRSRSMFYTGLQKRTDTHFAILFDGERGKWKRVGGFLPHTEPQVAPQDLL